jgi:hypothetical protein
MLRWEKQGLHGSSWPEAEAVVTRHGGRSLGSSCRRRAAESDPLRKSLSHGRFGTLPHAL